jgi:uncharacterized protein YabE (DUF348 family)
MRSLSKKSLFPRYALLATSALVVVILGISLSSSAQAASTVPVAGERLITIHDNGKTKGIITKDTTLRQAFKDAGIAIDPNDLVEPGLDVPLVANNYEINIYRARPITIIDGASRVKVMSAYQTAQQIVQHAGITLQDEDITTMDINTNMVSEGAGVSLTITRATPLTLLLYGTKTTIYTQAKTVSALLSEKKIKMGSNDTLSSPMTAPIQANMTLELWRNGTQTATQEQDIPFDTKQTQDADQPVGYKQVQTPGVAGQKMVTYEIDMKNGQEVSRTEIQNVTTKQPVTQVEIVGTKVSLPPGSHQDWMAAAGIASSDYGYVEYIVDHEGSWAPCKVQGGTIDCSYSGSMGYGIVQATPGSKMASAGDDWRTNPITQLRWATGYAVGRYGSWAGAYNHWTVSHNW